MQSKQTGPRRYLNSLDENRFYVYGHFTADTDELFYIGKGSAGRYKSSNDRSSSWNNLVKQRGFVAKILIPNLIEKEALDKESELIVKELETNPLLVNNVKSFTRTMITFEEADNLLQYDESSPSCLRWKKSKKAAGWLTNKYWAVEVNSKTIPAHRLVYLLTNGEIDWNLPIDHIDGDGFNNKKENLRNVTTTENNRNRIKRNQTNVPFLHSINRNGKFHAYFVKFDLMGKRVTIYFYMHDYQNEQQTKAAAITYLKSVCDVLKLCGYSERLINEIYNNA